MRELEHPTPALVEELQHSAGNRAVTRLLQREPKTAPPPAAPPLDEVLDEYFQLLTDVASSNQKSVTGFRRDFMRDLEAELGGEYRAFAEAQDAGRQPAPAAVKRFQDRLLEYQNQWFFERERRLRGVEGAQDAVSGRAAPAQRAGRLREPRGGEGAAQRVRRDGAPGRRSSGST